MHPFLLYIGGYKLPAYGFMVALGYSSAIFYLLKSRASTAITREAAADLVFYSALAGILGAKAVFAATYWNDLGPDLASKLFYILKSFRYGFVFYGGLGAGQAQLFCRLCRLQAFDHCAQRSVPCHSRSRKKMRQNRAGRIPAAKMVAPATLVAKTGFCTV